MNEYDDMTNADVMSADEIHEYDRDAEFALDAADEARALEEDAAQAAEVDDDLDDCGAVDPNHACGICAGCREATGDDIERRVEAGYMTESEARAAHELNGTWGS